MIISPDGTMLSRDTYDNFNSRPRLGGERERRRGGASAACGGFKPCGSAHRDIARRAGCEIVTTIAPGKL